MRLGALKLRRALFDGREGIIRGSACGYWPATRHINFCRSEYLFGTVLGAYDLLSE
jgi:hypothetical protein